MTCDTCVWVFVPPGCTCGSSSEALSWEVQCGAAAVRWSNGAPLDARKETGKTKLLLQQKCCNKTSSELSL